MGEPYLWRTANMYRRTCVVVKQMQSNPSYATACVTAINQKQNSSKLGGFWNGVINTVIYFEINANLCQ